MSYIDGFVIAVATADKEKFIALANKVGSAFIDHGATRVVECWGADVPKGKTTDFQGAVAAQDDETVQYQSGLQVSAAMRPIAHETTPCFTYSVWRPLEKVVPSSPIAGSDTALAPSTPTSAVSPSSFTDSFVPRSQVYLSVGRGMIDAAGSAAAGGGGLGAHAVRTSTATAATVIDAFMSSLLASAPDLKS
jgi:uncharacterized protein YbaA (DUF1428 family)